MSQAANSDRDPLAWLIILALILLVCLARNASAAASSNTGNDGDLCRSHTVVLAIGVVAAGDIAACVHAPSHVAKSTNAPQISAMLTSPTLSGANPSLVLTLAGLNGCTASSATTFSTLATAATGPETGSTWTITMTNSQCRGYIEAKVTSGTTVLFDVPLAFNIEADDTARNIAGSLSTHQDPLSGTITVHQNPVNGSLDIHQDPVRTSVDAYPSIAVPLAFALAIVALAHYARNHYLNILAAGTAALGIIPLPSDLSPLRIACLLLAIAAIAIFAQKKPKK